MRRTRRCHTHLRLAQAKQWELDSAQANVDATERQITAVVNRQAHYEALLAAGLNQWEHTEEVATNTESILNGAAATLEFISGVLHLLPQLGSPFAMKYGGIELGTSMARMHGGTGLLACVAHAVAASAGLEARNDRRREEWQFQRDQAKDELSQLQKRLDIANIGQELAQHAIAIHEKNIAQNDELLEYYNDKFSGLGLYTWMASDLQRTYREAYGIALRMARYAEQAYRFEREDYANELLSGQYWDMPHAGLLAGNKLALDLQLLEQRYIETDDPKRELVDHCFSLRQWHPTALIKFRQDGECNFDVPELFFDLASPGDYHRRLRSVRVTIPAVAGPYTNVMATLSLGSSKVRYQPSVNLQDAPRPRVDSITTSSARNDAGAFELNFRGEKYVPFEGSGAVSSWSLRLPKVVRSFDYDTISDVVLHLDYTASFDGDLRDVIDGVTTGIVQSARDRLASGGMARAFSLKEEFPSEFHRLVTGETVELEITADYLPFFMRFATVTGATLVFTGKPGESTAPSKVEFDGTSLAAPADDTASGGKSSALNSSGTLPWKHKFRMDGLSLGTACYIVLNLGS